MQWPRSLLGMLLLMAGCGASSGLPASFDWRGGCPVGVGRDATLHGSAADPRVTWATDNGSGTRFELLWPFGYRARFDPSLELVDSYGAAVGHEGDQIVGSCLSQPGDGGAVRVDASEIRPATWQPGDG